MKTIEWKIERASAYTSLNLNNDVIFSAIVSLNVVEDGVEILNTYREAVYLPPPTSTFLPVSEVSKEMLLTWIKNALGVETVTQLESKAYIAMLQLDASQIKVVDVLPWHTTNAVQPIDNYQTLADIFPSEKIITPKT